MRSSNEVTQEIFQLFSELIAAREAEESEQRAKFDYLEHRLNDLYNKIDLQENKNRQIAQILLKD